MDIGAWRRVTLASLLARLPLSMSILALPLAARRAGHELAFGAVLTGVTALTAGSLGSLRGRRLDRREVGRGLQVSCGWAGGVLVGLALAVAARAPAWVLVGLCLAEGASIAGVFGGFRALLWVVAPGRDLGRPQVFETLMTEVGYVLGPLAVLGLNAAGGPVVVLVAMAALLVMSAGVLVGLPRLPATGSVHQRLDRAMWTVVLYAALVGGSFSMVENSVPARMRGFGLSTGSAGAFLALLSLGSCVGGAVASAWPPGRDGFGISGARLAGGLGVLVLPATLAASPGWFGVLVPLSSVLLVPALGLAASEVERLSGDTGRAHRFSALVGAQLVGGGTGAIGASALISVLSPAQVPRVSAAALWLVAVVLTATRRTVIPSRRG